MSSSSDHSHHAELTSARRDATRDAVGVSLGVAAWGLVTGVAMVKSGLPVWAALVMTFTVYAGSAQLAALPLLAAQVPLWVLVATLFCVNLRFVIYSAQWRPYLVHLGRWRRYLMGYLTTDMSYVLCLRRYPEPPQSAAQREVVVAYIARSAYLNWLVWQVPSVLGIVAAEWIPSAWGLGFAGVLALLALIFGQVRDRRAAVAGIVAAGVAVAAYGLPFKLHIVVAIVAAVAIGLWMDRLGSGLQPVKPVRTSS